MKLFDRIARLLNSQKPQQNNFLDSANDKPVKPRSHTYTLSEDMSLEELETTYYDVVLKQDFYGDNYGADWDITPYQSMAKILSEIFSPQRHLDIGCGKGLLVQAMRNLGNKSDGIDFSQALIGQAHKSVQPHLTVVSAENWLRKAELSTTDLITFTEVFEHLPISVLEENLKSLTSTYNGNLLLTIPSYGLDSTFKLGIRVNNGNPQWNRDMMQNILFKNIVLEDGLPHHGHITLASYRWWSEFFLFHSYARHRDLEKATANKFYDTLKIYNWYPYILSKAPSVNDLTNCLKTGLSLGDGWHNYESFGGRWTDGFAKIYFCEESFNPKHLFIKLSVGEINYIQEFNLIVTIDNLVRTKSYQFKWVQIFSTQSVEINNRDVSQEITFNLFETPNNFQIDIPSNCYRLNLISPYFCPYEYGISDDSRRLGIIVHSLQII